MTSRRARGFTLIEMVLAVTLFSFLMASYYVVFIRVVELEEYARNQRAFASIGPAVLDLVEDDLLSLYTHPREPKAFPFRGTDNSLGGEPADRVDFVARRSSIHQEEFHGNDNWVRSPINEVGYRVVRGDIDYGDVRRLFRREHYYVDETPLQGGDYYEIYDRVVAFDLAYAGYRVEEEERESLDTKGENSLDRFDSWDSEERRGFPSAVIVTLTVEPPQLSITDRAAEKQAKERRRRTFVRVIPLAHADDIPYPEAGTGGSQPGTSR